MTKEEDPGGELELSDLASRAGRDNLHLESTLVPFGQESELARYSALDRWERALPSNAVLSRIKSLARQERAARHTRTYPMPWSTQDEAYGFVAAVHTVSSNSWSVANSLIELDRAARRALMILREIEAFGQLESWPSPLRPSRGGLTLVWSRSGSFDAVLTAYGAVSSVAQSQPVSIVSLIALVLDSVAVTRRAAKGWKIKLVRREDISLDPPLASGEADGEKWEERTTKRLQPVLLEAVRSGAGVQYECGDVRIIVPPSSRHPG